MADEPISALTQIAAPTGTPPYATAFTNPSTGAMLEILDTTNTSMASTGTNSRIAPGDMIKGFLNAGTNVTLTETSGVVTIASTGGGSPGGSAGQIQYNNTTFAGAADWSIGSSGQLVATPISAPSAAIGNLWFDSARDTYGFVGGNSAAGQPTYLGGIVWQGLGDPTVFTAATNSNAVASAFSITQAGTSIGSLTFPANSLVAGKIITPYLHGIQSFPSGPPTFRFQITLGGNVIWQCPYVVVAQTTTASVFLLSPAPTSFLHVTSVGSSGKVHGVFQIYIATGATVTSQGGGLNGSSDVVPWKASVAQTINTTVDLALDFKIQYGSAVTGTTSQLLSGYVRVDG